MSCYGTDELCSGTDELCSQTDELCSRTDELLINCSRGDIVPNRKSSRAYALALGR